MIDESYTTTEFPTARNHFWPDICVNVLAALTFLAAHLFSAQFCNVAHQATPLCSPGYAKSFHVPQNIPRLLKMVIKISRIVVI